jgi:HTH-type transcriptional regulator/antitoxin HigA
MDDRDFVEQVSSHFEALSKLVPLRLITTTEQLDQAVAVLNRLLDCGGADEQHPLAGVVTVLGELIGRFEDATYPAADVEPSEMLRFLMVQHRLGESDLPDVGTQRVVSEILNKQRELNLRQIKALAARFHLPPGVFLR